MKSESERLAATAIAQIDRLSREISAIQDIPRLKSLADKAEALSIWAKRQRLGVRVEYEASKARALCARRAGELLLALDRGYKGSKGDSPYAAACKDASIPQWQARLWQRLAEVDESTFQDTIAEAEAHNASADWSAGTGGGKVTIRKLVRGAVDKGKSGRIYSIELSAAEVRKVQKVMELLGDSRTVTAFLKACALEVVEANL